MGHYITEKGGQYRIREDSTEKEGNELGRDRTGWGKQNRLGETEQIRGDRTD